MKKDYTKPIKWIIFSIIVIYLFSGTIFEMVYITDLMKPIPWLWLKIIFFLLDFIFCFGFDLFVLFHSYKFIFKETYY